MALRPLSCEAPRPSPCGDARAIFLDKDGTLIVDVAYNVDVRFVALAEGAARALARWAAAGFRLIVVSNQSGVADGRFSADALRAVERRIAELLAPAGVTIDAFYYCLHAADEGCACRKPAPGLVERAAREHRIDLAESWFVGDILDDVEAGHRAGCRAALIANGNETMWKLSPLRAPELIASTLPLAANLILAAGERRPRWEVGHATALVERL
jgi:histidinol-phosphate phosphatase family protein